MKSTLWLVSLCAAALVLAACGGEAYTYPVPSGTLNTPGGGTGTSYPTAYWTQSPQVLLTARSRQQSPTSQDSFNGVVPMAHLGISHVDCGFEFTTPAHNT